MKQPPEQRLWIARQLENPRHFDLQAEQQSASEAELFYEIINDEWNERTCSPGRSTPTIEAGEQIPLSSRG